MIVAFAALFFGCIAFIAVQASSAVCANIEPADDGPAPGSVPYVVIIIAAGAIGAILTYLNTPPLQLGVAAIVIFALAACWCSDAICGFLPDAFTLGPLAALLLFALAQRDWGLIVSALIIFVPFAVAALFSRGIGMGWGDAKLVALTGAALGAPLAAFTLAIACVAAAFVHWLSGGRTRPIAFAPYIAVLTGLALPVGLLH